MNTSLLLFVLLGDLHYVLFASLFRVKLLIKILNNTDGRPSQAKMTKAFSYLWVRELGGGGDDAYRNGLLGLLQWGQGLCGAGPGW